MRVWKNMVWAVICVALCLAGCGGGSGSSSTQVVTGVAATGGAMSGTVNLKDSSTPSKEVSAPIQPDGSFVLDVGGMSAPFILKAVGATNGKSYTLYSFATKAGAANVNPLSNLAVAIANGCTDPSDLYLMPDPVKLQAMKVALPRSLGMVQQALQADFAEAGVGTADFMAGAYVVNHQGLDLMFDRNEIALSNGSVSITNRITHEVANYSLSDMQRIAGGTLDSSFGTGGIVTFAPNTYNMGEKIVIQPDGKILALGFSQQDTFHGFFLSRHHPDGSIDSTFGDGGVLYGPYNGENSLALQSDGKILVAGNWFNGANNISYIIRYDAYGKSDLTFGSGGSVLTDSTKNQSNVKVAVKADGKIILAGSEWDGVSTPFMLRLNGDGSLDGSFGNGSTGKSYLNGHGSVSAMAIGTDGSMFVGVNDFTLGSQASSIYKLDPHGIPDTTFGSAGKFTTGLGMAHQYITEIKLDNVGNVIAAMGIDRYYDGGVIITTGKLVPLTSQTSGLTPYLPNTTAPGVALLRLKSDGFLDPTFGQGGTAMFTSGTRGLYPSGVVIQPDGKFVMSGSDFNSATALAIMRLNVDGSIDNSFGTAGLVNISIGSYGTDGRDIALQGDGKIVVVGKAEAQSGGQYPSSMVFVRCFP